MCRRTKRAKGCEGIERRIDRGNAYYCSPIIYIPSVALHPRAQRTEINGMIILPKHGMAGRRTRHRVEFAVLRGPSDPPARVDRAGAAAVHLGGKRPEISEDTILPSKSVTNRAISAIAG